MSDVFRIIAVAGSTRTGSFNRAALACAAEGARTAGAVVTELDLRDYALPIYNGDVERTEGLPDASLRLKALFSEHDAFLIASPEYNSSITPLLKNTLDWASRSVDGHPGLAWATGKAAAIVSASGGALGGLRGLRHLREILTVMGLIVIPRQKAVTQIQNKLNDRGELTDDADVAALRSVGSDLAKITARLRA